MSGSSDLLVQIPPAKSPLLLPSDQLRQRRETSQEPLFYHQNSYNSNNDNLDDLEFLAPSNGSWDGDHEDEIPDEDDDSDNDSIEDFSLEDGHIAGVPCAASLRMDARQYQLPHFADTLLTLLRDDLRIPGWFNLPPDLPATLLHIHKVSGSLTNAVFFVSIPAATFQFLADPPPIDAEVVQPPKTPTSTSASSSAHTTPRMKHAPLMPLTVGAELERVTTPTPEKVRERQQRFEAEEQRSPEQAIHSITIEAPTLLLRVYGPSSGALISRKTELHILHTLSSSYGIGPRVLGTFGNGRVEEYFHSRAIVKEEMRDPRISRWIGRRMRELHRVPLEMMEVPGGDEGASLSSRIDSRSGSKERPSIDHGPRQMSSGSIYSSSSGSSIFSFNTSAYSTSSGGSYSSSYLGSEFGTPVVQSPLLLAQGQGRRGSSESRAERKKRSSRSFSTRRTKDKLGAWENITRWTREAKLVLKELDQLAALPGFSDFLGPPPADGWLALHDEKHVTPLSSPNLTFALREALNLPLFEQQVKLYRGFVRGWEKSEGKSKRVFSHNDTQYGNLLLLTPDKEEDERALERTLQAPHQKIIVVDFEYASANPRGFDIANHFIEWQADYHHPSLSHSLGAHGGYPTSKERARFLRSYVGCDGGVDSSESSVVGEEDPRVVRLLEEVKVWEPSSHAMWAVWGIVQAKEDLLYKVAKWKKACERREKSKLEEGVKGLDLGKAAGETEGIKARPTVTRGKSGETVGNDEDEEDRVADFDYLSYSLGRMNLFRQELKQLGIVE
ncbi:hypothetical protein T439DRAFT_326767 [Meredithblackwellia eburnea MCA 4105]